MSPIYKILIGLGLLVGVYLGGYYMGRGDKEVQVVVKEGKEKIVYRDRTVTVTKTVYPDGRVEEKTETKEVDQVTDKETHDSNNSSKPTLSQYALGAKYWLNTGNSESYQNIEVTAGRRLLGDIWLDLGIRADLQAAAGVSVRW